MHVIKRMLGALSALAVIAVPTVTPTAHADVDEVVGDSMIYVHIVFTGTVLVPGDQMKSGKNTWSPPVATTIDAGTAPSTDTKETPPKA